MLRPNESGRETLVDHLPNRKSTTATRLRDKAFSGSRTARACSHHGLLSSRGPRGGCALAEKPEGHSQARPEDELDAQLSPTEKPRARL